jgi:transposase-like protein
MKTQNKEAAPARRAERTHYSAREKCQAVLAIWAERRKPSEVCQELGIQWVQLNQWQDQAMEGMLKALEPRTRTEQEKGPALGPKLQQLLERKAVQRAGKMARLELRLARIQRQKEPAETKEPPKTATA